ncbi:hypothetical protein [Mycolicibacterium sp. P1-5]|uniref:hypothetical protein n=1 Tax=Mycolicibacterium sp. P1-5 TaxID=2024617 RepID=UPI0011ED6BAE|nr:hypothetical protein [Mycolicibacterium sp. P1-5]KAA0111947.1 hypothetical protein CIW47_01435 [Mycolicibacterium sp. P1-5]
MDLRWWPIALAGVLALAVCVVLAMALPSARADRTLRPLAHVDRLTALPEYARIRRRETVLAVTTIALLVVLFLSAALTAARPSGSGREFEALHPKDVMLCVGAPVTDGTTSQFLNHFARQATTYDAQRIGLTSPTVRVLPLTRDYQYAAQRLGEYGAPNAAQAAEFAKTVSYTDYAPSLRDTLALCMTGFGTEPTSHRRSLIYLGPSTFSPGDERSLFSGQQVADMADKAGIQVNAIARVDVSDAAQRGDTELSTLAERSGGRFFRYHAGDSDPTLTDDVDAIRANPAPVVLPGGARITGQLPDEPGPLLVTGLAVAALLGVALVVVRR